MAAKTACNTPGLMSGLAVAPNKVSLTCIDGIGVSTACRFMDSGVLELWGLASEVCRMYGSLTCDGFLSYMRPLLGRDRCEEEVRASAKHASDLSAMLFGAQSI